MQTRRAYFLSIQEISFPASKQRWTVSTNSVKDREPFNYRNFKAVAGRFVTYSNIILREGPYWLGCRFRSLIIWYPPKGYWSYYELRKGHEGITFVELIQKHGFRLDKEKVFPAYSLTALHINYLCSRGRETR